MSEQPGKAAGTAEPTELPTNFNKPWRINPGAPCLIMDADGGAIANVAAPYMIRGISENEREAFAAHIVACVNFCSELDSDLLEALSGGEFKITCQRIAPALAAELADNSKQFHADHADKPVAILTGGAI